MAHLKAAKACHLTLSVSETLGPETAGEQGAHDHERCGGICGHSLVVGVWSR